MTKKLGFKLVLKNTPFYTILKSTKSRKDILFTFNLQNQYAEFDPKELTRYAVFFLEAGVKSGFIEPIDKAAWEEFLRKVKEADKKYIEEAKGGDVTKDSSESSPTELHELLTLSVSKFKDHIDKMLLESESKDEVVNLLSTLKAQEELREDKRSSIIKYIDSKLKEIEEGLYENLK